MNWMPNWNDRVFNTINRVIPEGWFIDRFALFHSYELNVMAAFSTIVVVMTIVITIFVGIFGENKEEEDERTSRSSSSS
ncbi:hypothetical protein ACE1TH_11295 [Shouchella sp. JSM 1781072]|uniref:hypothetical protein n=1 Tax=Shouchella sp. JSM 1781072 TaxID=3344581 RepID=UPI0035C19893